MRSFYASGLGHVSSLIAVARGVVFFVDVTHPEGHMASHVLTTKKRGGGTVETPARPSPEKKARDSSAIPRVAERALERGSLLGSGELNDVYRARWNFSAVALKVVRAQPRRAAKSASAPDAVAATAAEPPSASLRRQLRARALQCMVHEARSLRALEDHGATW